MEDIVAMCQSDKSRKLTHFQWLKNMETVQSNLPDWTNANYHSNLYMMLTSSAMQKEHKLYLCILSQDCLCTHTKLHCLHLWSYTRSLFPNSDFLEDRFHNCSLGNNTLRIFREIDTPNNTSTLSESSKVMGVKSNSIAHSEKRLLDKGGYKCWLFPVCWHILISHVIRWHHSRSWYHWNNE